MITKIFNKLKIAWKKKFGYFIDSLQDTIQMINDKDKIRRKDGSDKKVMEKAAIKIQQWWRKRLFWKDFEELSDNNDNKLIIITYLYVS